MARPVSADRRRDISDFPVTLAVIALALMAGACDGARDAAAHGSITVKLPAARPATAAPGFAFQGSKPVRA